MAGTALTLLSTAATGAVHAQATRAATIEASVRVVDTHRAEADLRRAVDLARRVPAHPGDSADTSSSGVARVALTELRTGERRREAIVTVTYW